MGVYLVRERFILALEVIQSQLFYFLLPFQFLCIQRIGISHQCTDCPHGHELEKEDDAEPIQHLVRYVGNRYIKQVSNHGNTERP
ncbi:hypothetical protein [Olivibacter sp. 47]|uniref:hypothetical protein n=1 Tax=Olivibacter sp. 47 TaxID=3056486 RepID=UPI00338D7F29